MHYQVSNNRSLAAGRQRLVKPHSVAAGFTLVELLVVIAVIGILIALLLPAVQSAREAARRSQCQNGLKQICLAAINYENTMGHLPPGRYGCDGHNCTPPERQRAASGFLPMLPYLEEQPLYDQVDFSDGPWRAPNNSPERDALAPHRNNQPVIETVLEVMNCPSDEKLPHVEFKPIKEATGSYAFSTGTNGPSCGTAHAAKYRKLSNGRDGADGAFMYISGNERHGLQLKMITDGLSHTYFFGETIDGHLAETRNRWTAAGRYVDSLRSTENPMNTRPGMGGFEWSNDGYTTTGTFASRHPGGAQFAFGDGRVEFVSEDIALRLYQATSTRAKGDDLQGAAPPGGPGCGGA